MEEELPTFRPFTREELATIENRIFENKLEAKKKQEQRDKNIAVRKLGKGQLISEWPLASFELENEQKYFCISALAFKMGQIIKTMAHSHAKVISF